MELFITYLTIFITFCFLGWILEVIYRSTRLHRLVNPGFMTGPVLPIYGVGCLVLYIISQIPFDNIHYDWLIIVIKSILCGILMTLVEYIAGLISLKIYHNRLWDYSNRFGNIQGIICPTFSFIWFVLGLLFILFLASPMKMFGELIYKYNYTWLILGLVYGIFITDLIYSLKLMSKIRAYALKAKTTFNFVHIQENIRQKLSEINNKRISAWNEFKLRHSISQAFDNKNKTTDENLKDSIEPNDIKK